MAVIQHFTIVYLFLNISEFLTENDKNLLIIIISYKIKRFSHFYTRSITYTFSFYLVLSKSQKTKKKKTVTTNLLLRNLFRFRYDLNSKWNFFFLFFLLNCARWTTAPPLSTPRNVSLVRHDFYHLPRIYYILYSRENEKANANFYILFIDLILFIRSTLNNLCQHIILFAYVD